MKRWGVGEAFLDFSCWTPRIPNTQIKKARLRGPFVLTACFLLVPVVRVGMGFHLHQFRLGRRFAFDVAARILVRRGVGGRRVPGLVMLHRLFPGRGRRRVTVRWLRHAGGRGDRRSLSFLLRRIIFAHRSLCFIADRFLRFRIHVGGAAARTDILPILRRTTFLTAAATAATPPTPSTATCRPVALRLAAFNIGAIIGAAGSLRLGRTRTVAILTAALAFGLRRTFVPLMLLMRALMRSLSTATAAMAAMLWLMLACRAAFLDRRFLFLFFLAEQDR